jgi:hypothetical protein
MMFTLLKGIWNRWQVTGYKRRQVARPRHVLAPSPESSPPSEGLLMSAPYGHTWAGRNQMWHALRSFPFPPHPPLLPPSVSSHFFPPSPFPKNVRCPMTGFRETLFYLPLAPRWFPSLVSQKSGPAFIMLFDFGVPLKITSLKRPMIIWNSVQPGPNFCFSPYLNDKQC